MNGRLTARRSEDNQTGPVVLDEFAHGASDPADAGSDRAARAEMVDNEVEAEFWL